MAANDGTGQNWDITNPEDSDYMKNGAMEIRDLRKGVEIRINKEHDTLADNSAGGEHKAGSAKAYVGTTNPTKRPNGTSNLNASDAGRLFINSTTNVLHTLTAAAQWLAAGAGHLYSIIAGNFIISKRSGCYSYAFHNSSDPALKIAPSKTVDGTDFDFNKALELSPTGNVIVHGNLACSGTAAANGSTVLTAANLNAIVGSTVLTKADFAATAISSTAAKGTSATAAYVPILSYGQLTTSGSPITVNAFAAGYTVDLVIVHGHTETNYDFVFANKLGSEGFQIYPGSVLPAYLITISNNTFTISGTSGVAIKWTAFGHKL